MSVMYAKEGHVNYFGLHIPYLEFLGIEPIECGNDMAVTRLAYRKEIVNSRGHVHGGALLSMLDFTLSAAGRSHDPIGTGVATIDLNSSFLSPGESDLEARARCIRRGSSICFCEGEIVDASGQIVAKAMASFKLMRSRHTA